MHFCARFRYELIRKFLKIIEDKYKGQIVIDPRRWIGKELAIKIKHDEWMGKTKEKVHYVLTVGKALEITTKQKRNASSGHLLKVEPLDCESQAAEPNENDKIPFLF